MEILKRPILTEKITQLSEKLHRYAFRVDPRANKLQIKAAVEAIYPVHVTAVNTMQYAGKMKRRYRKGCFIRGHRAKYKKAIITLKEGETIDLYNNQ